MKIWGHAMLGLGQARGEVVCAANNANNGATSAASMQCQLGRRNLPFVGFAHGHEYIVTKKYVPLMHEKNSSCAQQRVWLILDFDSGLPTRGESVGLLGVAPPLPPQLLGSLLEEEQPEPGRRPSATTRGEGMCAPPSNALRRVQSRHQRRCGG